MKTTGVIPDQYVARQSAVDLKAATVPAEYRSAAREVSSLVILSAKQKASKKKNAAFK